MIQDIAPHVLDNQMRFTVPNADDLALVFRPRTADDPRYAVMVAGGEDELVIPTYEQVTAMLAECDTEFPFVYVLSLDESRIFLARPELTGASAAECDLAGTGLRWEPVSTLRVRRPLESMFAIYTAFHLFCWYRDNVFCGRCGHRFAYSHRERALECRSCGNVAYPRIAPAVIVAVTDGNRLLLSKRTEYAGLRHALIAGFTEIGETAEQTVQREVMEEVGIHVKNIRYYATQPWGFAGDLLIGYTAELDGSPELKVEEDELSWAGWVEREDIPDTPEPVSMTNEMIMAFKDGKF